MTNPLVSVVMPVFNRAWCVSEAIDSVLRLDCEDLELIVVDDGSTDGTSRILAEHAERDSRVRVINHEGRVNRGIARSRNLGAESSQSEYLAFLDSDDLFYPSRFLQSFAWLEEHRTFAGCIEPFTVESLGASETGPIVRHLTAVPEKGHGWLRAMLFSSTYWQTATLTIRREALLRFGGFDESLRVGEDTSLWLRLAATGMVGAAQSEVPVARVRRHQQHSWSAEDRRSEHDIFLQILLGLLRWSRPRLDVGTEAREVILWKLSSYLVEILSDPSLPLAFRVRAWRRAVVECHSLLNNRLLLANLLRAPFRFRQSAKRER